MQNNYKAILEEYLPGGSSDYIFSWLVDKKVHLKITRNRASKTGDYRPPIKSPQHRISVNHDLNEYEFLITLVHEMAHLLIWEKHQNKVRPHGVEWQQAFNILMKPLLENGIFPDDLKKTLHHYFFRAKASRFADQELTRLLVKYSNNEEGIFLEDLSEGSVFKAHNRILYRKQKKLRKRYRCVRLDNNKIYLFNPVALVEEVKGGK